MRAYLNTHDVITREHAYTEQICKLWRYTSLNLVEVIFFFSKPPAASY